MDSQTLSASSLSGWILSAVLLALLILGAVLLLKVLGRLEQMRIRERKMTADLRAREIEGMNRLLSKALTLISTSDPLAFQAVQAMESPSSTYSGFDPSDEAEAQRLADLKREEPEEALNGSELDILRDLGVLDF